VLSILLFNTAYSQTTAKSHPDLEQQFIGEVFGTNITKESQHFKNLLILLRERVEFKNQPFEKIEKYQKLSSIQLFNKYNESLKRDLEFNIETLNFFSSHRKVYRIDNTDWLIIINPKS
jgi:hypothetical protein